MLHLFLFFFSIPFLTFILAASRTTLPPSDSLAFVARMSHISFVNSALCVYEQGKASSPMVKVCRRPFSPPHTHTQTTIDSMALKSWNQVSKPYQDQL